MDGDGGAVEEAACSGGGLAGDEVRELLEGKGVVLHCEAVGWEVFSVLLSFSWTLAGVGSVGPNMMDGVVREVMDVGKGCSLLRSGHGSKRVTFWKDGE